MFFAIKEILPIDWEKELGKNTGIISQELIPIFLKYGYALLVVDKNPVAVYPDHETMVKSCYDLTLNRNCIICGINERNIPHCWVHKSNGDIYDEFDLRIKDIIEAWIPIPIHGTGQ